MCIAIPGKVVKIEGRKAEIKYPHTTQTAFVGDENIKVGDFVRVQMGVILQKIEEQAAKESLEAWEQAES